VLERRKEAAIVSLCAIGVFCAAVIAGGGANTDYSHRRDYISALASKGASSPGFGILAIASFGIACLATAIVVRPLSRTATVSVTGAGVGFVLASFARITCTEGAAGCGIGDRKEVDLHGAEAVTHEVLVALATLLLVIAMVAAGTSRIRGGRKGLGAASILVAVATVVLFFGQDVSSSSTGALQRLWVLVICSWVVGAAIVALRQPVARE
jgi:hypothetical protein